MAGLWTFSQIFHRKKFFICSCKILSYATQKIFESKQYNLLFSIINMLKLICFKVPILLLLSFVVITYLNAFD